MPSFWICCVCLLLFLPTSDSVPYSGNKCSKNDCSYQVKDFMNNTCKIYNTSDFYKFEESSDETLTSEEEFKFHVSIVPYTVDIPPELDTVMDTSVGKRPAINITFAINNSDIDELVVKIYTKNVSAEPICRIFDFHNLNNSTNAKFPINFFYDCFENMAQDFGLQNVRMDFIALPVKDKLSYYVFIPEAGYTGSCTWQPLIMVFRGNLYNGVVQVKFSQAPEFYNVSSYIIKLTHLSGGEKTVDITPDISRRMLFAQFSSVDGGAYSVSVKPVFWGVHDDCWTETDIFLIEKPKPDHMLTVYLCIFILLTFSAFVFLKKFRHNIAKLRFGSKRRILLLYSHDCNEHKDFVISFIQYLIKFCHVEVSAVYDELPIDWNPDEKPMNVNPNVNECNPQEWIKKKYDECDIIMYLISAGLFHTLDSKQFLPIQKYHEWRKQLVWATNFILTELWNNADNIRKKKICKVCFPYSSKEYIPDTLRPGFGKCYVLPQEMNNLINFMHDSGECFLCSKLCVPNFESSFNGTDLSKKMRVVQAAVDSNSHIRIIRPLSDTATNDLNFIEESVNPDEISTTSDSSDENSDYVRNFLSESIPKPISKETFAIDSNSHIRITRPTSDTATNDLNFIQESVNLDEISTTSNSSDENSDSVLNLLSGSVPKPIWKEKCANLSSSGPSDNIRPMIKSEDFVELTIHEPIRDSDSEESHLLHYQPKLHSENEAKYIIENILNKKRT